MSSTERILSCFQALASGDAIGKQTEMLSRRDVTNWYPGGITGFHGRPGDIIPRYLQQRLGYKVATFISSTSDVAKIAQYSRQFKSLF